MIDTPQFVIVYCWVESRRLTPENTASCVRLALAGGALEGFPELDRTAGWLIESYSPERSEARTLGTAVVVVPLRKSRTSFGCKSSIRDCGIRMPLSSDSIFGNECKYYELFILSYRHRPSQTGAAFRPLPQENLPKIQNPENDLTAEPYTTRQKPMRRPVTSQVFINVHTSMPHGSLRGEEPSSRESS